MKKTLKAKDSYGHIYDKVKQNVALHQKKLAAGVAGLTDPSQSNSDDINSGALLPYQPNTPGGQDYSLSEINQQSAPQASNLQLIPKKAPTIPKPKWHAPWKLYRVISGHLGWVRCVAVEPGNEWFVTGAADRVIKVWDLASGKLKLSLTGKEYFQCFEFIIVWIK